jgi:hypothetical protein
MSVYPGVAGVSTSEKCVWKRKTCPERDPFFEHFLLINKLPRAALQKKEDFFNFFELFCHPSLIRKMILLALFISDVLPRTGNGIAQTFYSKLFKSSEGVWLLKGVIVTILKGVFRSHFSSVFTFFGCIVIILSHLLIRFYWFFISKIPRWDLDLFDRGFDGKMSPTIKF